MKDSTRPARLYPALEQALEALAPTGAPVERLGPLLASDPLSLAEEYRVLVVEDTVVDASVYLDAHQRTAHDAVESGHRMAALAFARKVVRTVPPALVPSAWILDVARTAGGSWVPVEANPVWSSNPYGLDLVAVASAIRRNGSTPRDTALPWRLPAHWADRARPLPAGAAA